MSLGDKGSTDPSQLTEGGGIDDGNLKPREFFWDSVVLYLVSVILALSAVDALTEFIRGTGVHCLTANGQDVGDYINGFCAGSLPITEYIPAFIFIHGLAIAIPHFLWLATFGGQFDYFFSVVKTLDHFKDAKTGAYSRRNTDVVRQLEHSFTIYGRNSIFLWYVGKLLLQFVFATASLVLIVYQFTDFESIFPCPRHNDSLNSTLFPMDEPVTCVFSSLKLLFWIKIADIFLICLIVLSVMWGFWFCISGHPSELSAEKVAQFVFQSGIEPDLYVSSRWNNGYKKLFRYFCRYLSFPPRISTDLDFMMLKLFRTNAGFGKTFKSIQIELRVQKMAKQDCFSTLIFQRKWTDKFSIDPPDDDLNWKFDVDPKKSSDQTKPSPHDVFEPTALKESIQSCRTLEVPDSIRGAILGLAMYSSGSGATLSITFHNAGYGSALARLFPSRSIIFTDTKREIDFDEIKNLKQQEVLDQLIDVEKTSTENINVTVPSELLKSSSLSAKVFGKIASVLTHKKCFIVVGPVTKDQYSVVNLFVNQLCKAGTITLEDGCIIVFMRPVKISGKNVSKEFVDVAEPPQSCKPFPIDIIVSEKSEVDWPSIKTNNEKQAIDTGKKDPADQDVLLETGGIATEEKHSSLPEYRFHCGDTETVLQFRTYKFNYEQKQSQQRHQQPASLEAAQSNQLPVASTVHQLPEVHPQMKPIR